ncbi:DUF3592 domain-containing protein [Corallococcus carmarthensis]|uniref:DUF3592 domain-containing protein n=1 Tax=Corallococcus carmarthensis TaxID=2316728 RepID=UPI00148DF554|nr:DUF3592 domain-containing protein [Corallococcus carmarthensis]NOK23709.1 DUF3592 domain-containing protein [Corallococcus carmarthensis]
MNLAKVVFDVVCIGVVPLVGVVWAWRPYLLTQKLLERGVHTKAKVVRAEDEKDDGTTYWRVEYAFRPPGAPEVRGDYQHDKKKSRPNPQVGDALELSYLPEDPRKHQLVGQEAGLARTVFLTCFFMLFLIIPVFRMLKHQP